MAEAGVFFTLDFPGSAVFQLLFEGADIAASQRDGPYRLEEIELLDGSRGFIPCERRSDGQTTGALGWRQFAAAPPPPRFIRGDANVDGRVDISDALSLLEELFLAGAGSEPCADAADVNADRRIDITDPVYLLDALFLSGAPVPAPFPACGSADGLGCARNDGCP